MLYADSNYNKDSGTAWFCKCQCGSGTIKSVFTTALRSGSSKGCGCNSAQRLKPYEALYNRMKADNNGRLRNIKFSLSYEEFVEFTKESMCYYCHCPIIWKKFTSSGYGYNLDRKENTQGYFKDNLVVCCKRCNMGKRDTFSFEEWYGMTAYFRESR